MRAATPARDGGERPADAPVVCLRCGATPEHSLALHATREHGGRMTTYRRYAEVLALALERAPCPVAPLATALPVGTERAREVARRLAEHGLLTYTVDGEGRGYTAQVAVDSAQRRRACAQLRHYAAVLDVGEADGPAPTRRAPADPVTAFTAPLADTEHDGTNGGKSR